MKLFYISIACRVSGWLPAYSSNGIPFDMASQPWLTLITRRGYDQESDSYRWRVAVRAVQVDVR